MNSKEASVVLMGLGAIGLVIAFLNLTGSSRVEVMNALMLSSSIIIAGGMIAFAISSRRSGQ